MKKRLLSILLALCMVLALLPGTAWAAETSGKCGDNLTWSYSNGTLTIEGTGDMPPYGNIMSPWYNYREEIHTVSIGDGVTGIGSYAFSYYHSLTSVIFPENGSLTSIGAGAFEYCSSLVSAIIPNSVTTIEQNAFSGCNSLTSVTISSGVTNIKWAAFYGCSKLAIVTIPNSVTTIEQNAFYDCNELKEIYYSGSREQWKQISIGDGNDPLLKATIQAIDVTMQPTPQNLNFSNGTLY